MDTERLNNYKAKLNKKLKQRSYNLLKRKKDDNHHTTLKKKNFQIYIQTMEGGDRYEY